MHRASRTRRLSTAALEIGALAAVAFVPLLLTKPGMVAADTKQYLYLDPGRLLSSALSMWDPNVAAGTVTHQNIGYLFPQGPFYYLAEVWLHVPTWVAQRLWMASLLFVAGTGIRYLARVVGLSGGGVLVASLAYELSPYSMQYIERISAILMPWAGLGWMLAFTILAVRHGGWRYPALVAIAAAAAGGTNATSIVFAGLAPVTWILYAVFATREAGPGEALRATGRIGLLTLATALWWLSGLRVEAAAGINVLIYTETLPAIASSSVASEVLRGLGYWYFYGSDRVGPWLGAAVAYEERTVLLVTSYALPALGVLGAAVTRWRERAYFVFVTFIGLVLAVGTHPFSHPSVAGAGLKAFMTKTTAGLALRSSDRATPLVVLGLTMLLGAGVSALWEKARWPALAVTAMTTALVVINAAPLITGDAVAKNFERVSRLPAYNYAAARFLDTKPATTRVLIEPGEDFADYTYGDTVDPIWPGIMTRPTLQRQQLIDGSYATADLLEAFDLAFQQGTYVPSTLAPIARLLSAGDMLWQSNLAFWRYDTPLPKAAWAALNPPPPGVGKPLEFGGHPPNIAPAGDRFIDEQALSLPANQPWPPPVAVFPISGARPIDRAEPAAAPLILDGSGAGLVDAAATGMLNDNPTIFYAGSLAHAPRLNREALVPGASLVVTDSNRKELQRFESEAGNIGETLPAVTGPTSYDPTQVPLDIFGPQPPSAQTVAQYTGAVYVTASSYGNSVAETPEDRPYMAFDSNPATAWSTSAFASATGQWIQVKLATPTRVDHLHLSQILGSTQNRRITKVTLLFDGAHDVTVRLGQSSLTPTGQRVDFRPRTFQILRVRIDSTSWRGAQLTGASGVGFSQISIPGVHLFEWIRLPEALLARAGPSSLSHRLTVIFTRDRVAPFPPRSDPEPFLARRFWLPTARRFSLSGTARLSALIPDNVIDDLIGGPRVFGGDVIGSNERLPGDLNARAAFAFDGNPKTFWSPGFGTKPQLSAWVEASLRSPISFDHMNLQLVADGRHSVPTELRISSNRGMSDLVDIPPIRDRTGAGSVVTVPLSFPRISGTTFRFSIVKIRPVTTINWYSQKPITLPVAIAEMGVPGIRITPENPRAQIPALCRRSLLRIDGKQISLEVTGTVAEAEALAGLRVRGCGPDAHGLPLGPGEHTLVATSGQTTGFNLDQLALDSAAGGRPERLLPSGNLRPVAGTIGAVRSRLATPTVHVTSSGNDKIVLRLTGLRARHGFWLVLGQSFNKGWAATVGGRSLGPPVLIDGYANGWYVAPSSSGPLVVHLDFLPQRLVDAGLVLSAGVLWLCLILAVLPERARRAIRTRARGRPTAHSWPDGTAPHHGRAHSSEPDKPVLARLHVHGEARPGTLAIVVTALTAGAVAGVTLPGDVALPGAIGVLILSGLAAYLGRGGLFLCIPAFVLLAAAGGYVVHHQLATHFPPGSAWPLQLDAAGAMGSLGIAILVGDGLADIARRRAARRRAELGVADDG
ncbi:MAG: alpha-(1-_3)-arabinofuranosyltransferase domain-containing protein [Acidimicrobiales bacterium]